MMIISNDTTFAYAESIDALHWTLPIALGDFGPIAAYPTAPVSMLVTSAFGRSRNSVWPLTM